MRDYQLEHGDAIQLMRGLPSGSIDLIASDVPYPVISGGNTTKTHATGGILVKNDGKIFKHNDCAMEDYLPEFYRVLRDDAHCYVFTNTLNLAKLLNLANDVGFKLHNLLVWKKNNVVPNRWYMKQIEYICFFRKGRAFKVNDNGISNCLEFDNPRNKQHECEKPVALMEVLVRQSSQPRETVLDPFMGCCSTGVAAIKNGRKFIGYEIDPEYFELSKERMSRYANEAKGLQEPGNPTHSESAIRG